MSPTFQESIHPNRTGRRWCADALGIALVVGLLVDSHFQSSASSKLVEKTLAETVTAPTVKVASAEPVPAIWPLNLPGETAAWNDSKIYSRVNGYVDKWFAD